MLFYNQKFDKNAYNAGLIYCINSIIYTYNSNNAKIKNKKTKAIFYKEVQKLLKTIYDENEFNEILKTKIKYRELERILKNNFYKYNLLKFIDKIFSVYKELDKIKINILGIKITLPI